VEKNRTSETSKMFIAMNRFKVIKEERKAFEDLWVARESHLDEGNGFQAFHLLRGRGY
jgi:heme-degrading monooxygenase HmoA